MMEGLRLHQLVLLAALAHALEVQVQQGKLRGAAFTSLRSERPFYGFLGVPYAKAPLANLRFKAPQQAEPWTGVRDATEERDVCIQMSFMDPVLEGKEDCLFLNVYAPEVPGNVTNASLMPVMVWIHGGGFAWGSGNRKLQGPDFLMDEHIVLVSLNYRLGAFGFLSLENEEAPGNAGLKDQVMALRWVRDNIKQFGGDPDDVTIFGQGSGAACVHYHMLSPVSEGLFHKAISQSGSVLCPWAYTRSARRVAFQLGALLGKNTTDDAVLLDFLRGVAPEEIAEVAATRQDLVPLEERDPLGFSPRFMPTKEEVYEDGEEVFLPGEPRELILEGKFEQVPHLVGSCSQDGYIIYHASQMAGASLQHLSDLVLPGMQQRNGVGRSIKSFYFGYRNISNETLPQFIKMATDLYFEFPAHETVKLQAALSTSPIYFYQFAFDGQYGAQELGYLFASESLASLNLSLADAEVQTSYDLVKMWTDFAKTGNPTPDDQLNIKWLPYNNQDHNCLLIDRGLTLAKDVDKDRMDFCEGLYDRQG